MSNLGAYQTMTELAKTVGGPQHLAIATAIGGYVTFRIIEGTSRYACKKIKKRFEGKKKDEHLGIFEVTISNQDESGVSFNIGDAYRVLTIIDKGMLIEKLGDEHNPYFVSTEFIKSLGGIEIRKGELK